MTCVRFGFAAVSCAMTKPKKQIPQTFSAIIDLWPETDTTERKGSRSGWRHTGSIQTFADDLGVKYMIAQQWHHRESIPADRFPAVVKAAQKRRLREVTLELLHSITPGWQRQRKAS